MRTLRCAIGLPALLVMMIVEPACAQLFGSSSETVEEEIASWSEQKGVVVAEDVRLAVVRKVKEKREKMKSIRPPAADYSHHYRHRYGYGYGYGWGGGPNAWFLLDKLPILHFVVQPVPPRDYSVKIKDHNYGAIEKICVNTGSISVRIERAGKPTCDWVGTLSEGDEQTVTCNF